MLYAIMTAYNEEVPLSTLLPLMPDRVHGHGLEIVVVDDGSADKTSQVAREHGCTVITLPQNRGKGAALRAGLDSIDLSIADGVILMDSDGQHDPSSLSLLTEPILEDTADMVVGSRYLADRSRGSTPLNRYLVRTATVLTVGRILGVRITDPYCGFRVFTPRAIGEINLCGDRYQSELEMLFCASRAGLRIKEMPIPKIYGDETSKMGARRGALIGRAEVVFGYATTIVREARKRSPKQRVEAPADTEAFTS